MRGVAEGCRQAGCALVGGETAELPGLYAPGEYDLAGFAVGVVERARIIDGAAVQPGDVVLGLALVRACTPTATAWPGASCSTMLKLGLDAIAAGHRAARGRRAARAHAHLRRAGARLLRERACTPWRTSRAAASPSNLPARAARGLPRADSIRRAWPVPPIFAALQDARPRRRRPRCGAPSTWASATCWSFRRAQARRGDGGADGRRRARARHRRDRPGRARRGARVTSERRARGAGGLRMSWPIGVLASGRGSNLQALLEACARPGFPAHVAVVISDRERRAGPASRARAAGIEALVDRTRRISPTARRTRRRWCASSRRAGSGSCATPATCGSSRRATSGTSPGDASTSIPRCCPPSRACTPSGRPSSTAPGSRAPPCTSWTRAWTAAPSCCRRRCRCEPGDTEETLSARILVEEHRLYPEAIRLFAEGRLAHRGTAGHRDVREAGR